MSFNSIADVSQALAPTSRHHHHRLAAAATDATVSRPLAAQGAGLAANLLQALQQVTGKTSVTDSTSSLTGAFNTLMQCLGSAQGSGGTNAATPAVSLQSFLETLVANLQSGQGPVPATEGSIVNAAA